MIKQKGDSMERKLIRQRVLLDEEPYLQVSVCADALDVPEEEFLEKCKDLVNVQGCGPCVKESEFNDIVSENYPDSGIGYQITKASTLDIKRRTLLSLMPLKEMFLKTMGQLQGKDPEELREYLWNVDFRQSEREYADKLRNRQREHDYIKEKKALLHQAMKVIPMEEYGMEFQVLLCVNEGSTSIDFFLAGDGFFKEYFPTDPFDPTNSLDISEYLGYEGWNDPIHEEDGSVRFFNGEYDTFVVPGKEGRIQRDFRKYSLMENLIFVATSAKTQSESVSDTFYKEDWADVMLQNDMIAQMINPKAYPEFHACDATEMFLSDEE